MWRLATSYVEDLMNGKGDADARAVFENAFAARESETVESNAAARKRRTFEYQGKSIPMMKHLKIGVKDSAAETLRIHFSWDAESKRVVIGHCGPHLDFD